MAVTIKDVARVAGLSQATAARALGGYGYASPAAVEAAAEAAQRLGYRPNGVARALVSRATRTVGLVVGDIENPFFAAAARGLADALEGEGHTVLLANSDEDPVEEQRAIDALRSHRVDGLVLASVGRAAGLNAIADEAPLVLLDRAIRGVHADAVTVDNRAGARQAVEHLVALGHRRIGIVSDQPSIASSAERLAGYRRGLADAGLPEDRSLVSIGGSTREDGHRAARALLDRDDRPTALFTSNNFMTYGAVLALRELGLSVPGDVALVGFDDLDWTILVDPPLTVVSQPVAELGATAGRLLLRRIAGDASQPRRVRLPAHLIVRGSCGAGR
jgi:LacI family transcriptional regulator